MNDDGEAIGLENDYAALRGDKDKFELHLGNLLRNHVDVTEIAKHVSISFPIVEGQEICLVDIGRAGSAWFTKFTSSDGSNTERLYVRSGNSSVEVPPTEIASFVSDRFS